MLGSQPINLSLRVQPLWLKVLSNPSKRQLTRKKEDLGVITAKTRSYQRTHAGKSMGNQRIGSRHILKMIEKIEDTMSP
ncbi:hypothetical protein CK203_061365 [Vitis vinifera]|uniref:Uncharacterized protein n=1 Tax=Vitis vinifera TaxID=29760 RepID=A0A438GAM8_VITVI|nr:hypothetical protein CK203_061365 [Vitis vinifera]